MKPLVNRGYSWASTYGNHDSKYNLSREDILREEQKYTGAYTQHGPPGTDGVSNYMLPIYASSASAMNNQSPIMANKPLALLYFLDSRGGSESDLANNDNLPNFVSAGTAAWLECTTASAKQKWGVLPSLAFVHIPINAFLDLQRDTKIELSGKHFPGLNADKPLAQQGYSAESNNVYTGQDIPFMQALLKTEGLHSVYSGHDHGDSWCGLWQNATNPSSPSLNNGDNYASNSRPFLCFCKHSGFGGYGKWNRGVRQVQLSFDEDGDMSVETWDRMQWGSDHPQVVTKITLNSTYGKDIYVIDDRGYHPLSGGDIRS